MAKRTVEERFWSKVDKGSDGCWRWTAAQINGGYGLFWNGEKNVIAHRYSYVQAGLVIPEGLHLDHLCRVRLCVRPDHLEPVTHKENHRRGESGRNNRQKTHCPQGHPYDDQNTRLLRQGKSRACRACDRIRHAAAYARKKGK